MNFDFLTSTAEDSFLANQVPLNVLLAYEDFPTGIHALRTFDMLFLDGEIHPRLDTHNVWKFDLLAVNKLREIAILEAASADMVILSAHGTSELPSAVRQWLEGWVDARPRKPGALAVMLDGGTSNPAARFGMESYLEDCGRRAGMDYFIQRIPGRNSLEASDVGPTTEKDWQAFEILTQVAPNSFQAPRWGLNE